MSEWQELAELGTGLEKTGPLADRQERWLLNCLRANAASEYGERHAFDSISSVDEYCERVPLVSYADIERDIQRMSEGEGNVLFAGLPIAFELTGGSTRGRKLIPYSRDSLEDFRTALLPWLGASIRHYQIESGTAYFSISPATRQTERTAAGIPIGLSDGAYLGAEALAAFAPISAVPAWTGELADVHDWQLATLYWLVRRTNLALISVWSPTFLLTLLDALKKRFDEVAALLRDGGLCCGHELAADDAAFAKLDRFSRQWDASHLWPRLKLVSCWADASSQPFFEELVQRLPHTAFQGKGLLSTEGIVTVPNVDGLPVLTPDSGFYEFRHDDGTLYAAQELLSSEQYEVVMTTAGGLYRYLTGDYVICEGMARERPVLRFCGRRGLTSDMVGEKLEEGFVSSCLADLPGFRMLVPTNRPRPGYTLIVDRQYAHNASTLVDKVDARLSGNPQYEYARRVGQLDKLSLYEATRPLEAYIDRFASGGARLGDLKVTALRAEMDWLETFSRSAP